jgi:hypothetical protein
MSLTIADAVPVNARVGGQPVRYRDPQPLALADAYLVSRQQVGLGPRPYGGATEVDISRGGLELHVDWRQRRRGRRRLIMNRA